MKKLIFDTQLWLIASLTLGLAPFLPEPHLLGKVRWIWGGAVGMQPVDWWDTALHGAPVIMLLVSSLRRYFAKK